MVNGTRDFLDFAHTLADRAAAAILPHFRNAPRIDDKCGSDAFDPVTEADRAAERVMRDVIEAAFPDHGIVGEEFGSERAHAEFCWTLDPIDGTRAFIAGLPLWGVLIGLAREGKTILGLMDQPFTKERFFASADGANARIQGVAHRLRTRTCPAIEHATLMTTGPDLFRNPDEHERFLALSKQTKLTRYGGDCYSYCMVASGHVDLVAESGLKSYDIMPLIPIIEQAGGRITTWEGGDASRGGRILAAGDPQLHDAALEVLNRKG